MSQLRGRCALKFRAYILRGAFPSSRALSSVARVTLALSAVPIIPIQPTKGLNTNFQSQITTWTENSTVVHKHKTLKTYELLAEALKAAKPELSLFILAALAAAALGGIGVLAPKATGTRNT